MIRVKLRVTLLLIALALSLAGMIGSPQNAFGSEVHNPHSVSSGSERQTNVRTAFGGMSCADLRIQYHSVVTPSIQSLIQVDALEKSYFQKALSSYLALNGAQGASIRASTDCVLLMNPYIPTYLHYRAKYLNSPTSWNRSEYSKALGNMVQEYAWLELEWAFGVETNPGPSYYFFSGQRSLQISIFRKYGSTINAAQQTVGMIPTSP